jgi:HAD superfamily hydrolase (TIGR01509 family)
MSIKAVIFDMDGVLVDSEVYWHLSRVEFARARGKTWTDADQRIAMGRSTVGWAQVMKDHLGLPETVEEIIVEMKQRVMAHYDERLPLRDGAVDAVRLSAANFKCALASGSPTDIIQHVMKLSGLDQVFEVIVYGDDFPNGKPAPDIYLAALDRLGVNAEDAIGIEDSSNGIRSLKAAGMRAVAAPSPGFPLSPEIVALCDAHIGSLTEFTLALIRSIESQ